jgi:ribose/xylose/arabinose/galactoside ABC-type transport system permease subunit
MVEPRAAHSVSRSPLGLLVAAISNSERAAHLSGHPTGLTKILVYPIFGFGAALAGFIQSSWVHTALATHGSFVTELDVIAAVAVPRSWMEMDRAT